LVLAVRRSWLRSGHHKRAGHRHVLRQRQLNVTGARRHIQNQVVEIVLGVVENMSMHICSEGGHHEPIFGTGGAQKLAEDGVVTTSAPVTGTFCASVS
jgi:hypothetical protein